MKIGLVHRPMIVGTSFSYHPYVGFEVVDLNVSPEIQKAVDLTRHLWADTGVPLGDLEAAGHDTDVGPVLYAAKKGECEVPYELTARISFAGRLLENGARTHMQPIRYHFSVSGERSLGERARELVNVALRWTDKGDGLAFDDWSDLDAMVANAEEGRYPKRYVHPTRTTYMEQRGKNPREDAHPFLVSEIETDGWWDLPVDVLRKLSIGRVELAVLGYDAVRRALPFFPEPSKPLHELTLGEGVEFIYGPVLKAMQEFCDAPIPANTPRGTYGSRGRNSSVKVAR